MVKDTILVSAAFTLLAVFGAIAIFSKSYWLYIDNSKSPVYNKIVRVTQDTKEAKRGYKMNAR